MGDSTTDDETLVHALAGADTLASTPPVVDVVHTAPPNPPRALQASFVGSSYLTAYAEAASFVRVANQWLERHRNQQLADVDPVIDFGAGWGRISRLLLAHVPPSSLFAVDVDVEMTALIGSTLPGVNVLTVQPYPPTVLRDGMAGAVLSFSVFSHLSPHAHASWARELGRLCRPGAMVCITLLDAAFFDQVQSAKDAVARGDDEPFGAALAQCFPDVADALRKYEAGKHVFAAVGGGGVRSSEFYGWAAAPSKFVDKEWGAAGFNIVEWVPSGILFPQAMVGLVKR